MLRFILSYLQGREQQVFIGGITSTTRSVRSGVPQGSILGPLIFVLFINDIFSCVSEDTNIALYADETKIWRVIDCSKDHFILQGDIYILSKWAYDNHMKFHPSKCKALAITYQRNIHHNLPFTIFNYKLNSADIDYVSPQVDLGVTVTSKLIWTEHHNILLAKATSQMALLMRTCHFPKRQKIAFYLSVINSLFEHCYINWRPVSQNNIFKFDAIQK